MIADCSNYNNGGFMPRKLIFANKLNRASYKKRDIQNWSGNPTGRISLQLCKAPDMETGIGRSDGCGVIPYSISMQGRAEIKGKCTGTHHQCIDPDEKTGIPFLYCFGRNQPGIPFGETARI